MNKTSIPATKSSVERGLLPVVLLSLALVVAAVPALNVALPNLAADTDASLSQLQWIVDAYALVFAGLLLPAGALGDRYGRKPVLIIGLVVFALGSAAASLTGDPDVLMVLRGVMGVGAALVMPTTLSIITSSFPAELRGRAVGAWVGVAGAGAVFGLLVSGALLEVWDWQSVFLFNAILAAVVAVAAVRKVPNSLATRPPRVDYVGGLLSVVALAGLVFGAIEGPGRGWGDPVTLAAFGTGVVGLTLWVAWGFIADEPLLDPRLFRNRAFSTGVFSITLQFFVFFGYVFVIVQYLQLVLDYSPLQAGLALVPMAIVLGGLSRRVPHLMDEGEPTPAGDRRAAPHGTRDRGARTARLGLVVLGRAGRHPSHRCGHGAGHVAGDHRHRRGSSHAQAGCGLGGQRRGPRGRWHPRHRRPRKRAQRAVPVRPGRSGTGGCSRHRRGAGAAVAGSRAARGIPPGRRRQGTRRRSTRRLHRRCLGRVLRGVRPAVPGRVAPRVLHPRQVRAGVGGSRSRRVRRTGRSNPALMNMRGTRPGVADPTAAAPPSRLVGHLREVALLASLYAAYSLTRAVGAQDVGVGPSSS